MGTGGPCGAAWEHWLHHSGARGGPAAAGRTWFSLTWRWSLEDAPAVASISTPSSFLVRNMSPRYQGTEMVMSRSLQDTRLSPLKRWG